MSHCVILMSSDISQVLQLLSGGIISRDEVAVMLAGLRRVPIPVQSPPNVSLSSPNLVEEKHHRCSTPLPSPPSSTASSRHPFVQSTLWNFGHGVKRKLPDGSVVMVNDSNGMPTTTPHHTFRCMSCLRSFVNKGALAIHIRFSHPSDEAALNRRHTSTTTANTSTTTTSLNTRKKNTSSTSTTTTSSTSQSSELIEVRDDDDEPKKKKKTCGASTRKRYTVKDKWVIATIVHPLASPTAV